MLGEAAFSIRQPFIERALNGQECSLDVEVARSDGRVRFGEARYVPHRDETGADVRLERKGGCQRYRTG